MFKTRLRSLLIYSLFAIFFSGNIYAQEGEIVVNQDRNIDRLLALKKEVNRTNVNYRIQIYNGNRVGAEKAKMEFRNTFSEWKADMKFQTPNYKIWVGNFKTRLEVDRALLKIKRKYPNAFPLKPKKNN